jgi:N6-L-threonylcarbamoyladenine synthase
MGLGYPGGPRVEKTGVNGRGDAFDFPRGNGPRSELDFSFSGLKTSLRYRLEKMDLEEVQSRLPDLCASYQQAVVDALVRKTQVALERRNWRSLGLSGGVANNKVLRAALARQAECSRIEFLAAEPRHAGDNAAMIGFAAWADTTGTKRIPDWGLGVEPNAPLG